MFSVVAAGARGQTAADAGYEEVFYSSGSLKIQAYLYRPRGDGPFPVVIYNHGSRIGNERRSVPFVYVGNLLAGAGYVVLVPERRGYGRSDGKTWSEEVGREMGTQFVARLTAEADDVIASLDYLRGLPFVAPGRIGIMGWSFGGIVTMLAISRSTAFSVAVNQAGGALTWNINAALREALVAAARKSSTPTRLLVAQNDRTTASITALAEVFKERNVPHRMVVYEAFVPPQPGAVAPGHAAFSAQGVDVWKADVLEFLAAHLAKK